MKPLTAGAVFASSREYYTDLPTTMTISVVSIMLSCRLLTCWLISVGYCQNAHVVGSGLGGVDAFASHSKRSMHGWLQLLSLSTVDLCPLCRRSSRLFCYSLEAGGDHPPPQCNLCYPALTVFVAISYAGLQI